MKKILTSFILVSITISIFGCGSESTQYHKELIRLNDKYTLEIFQVTEAVEPAIQSLSLNMKPSISTIQSEINDVVDIVEQIKVLEPPSSVKDDHVVMVRKMAEETFLYNELSMYLGTGQIDNATQTIKDITQLSSDIYYILDKIKEKLE